MSMYATAGWNSFHLFAAPPADEAGGSYLFDCNFLILLFPSWPQTRRCAESSHSIGRRFLAHLSVKRLEFTRDAEGRRQRPVDLGGVKPSNLQK